MLIHQTCCKSDHSINSYVLFFFDDHMVLQYTHMYNYTVTHLHTTTTQSMAHIQSYMLPHQRGMGKDVVLGLYYFYLGDAILPP